MTTTTHWQSTRSLKKKNATNVQPGGTVSIPVAINIPQVANQSSEIQRELGASAGQVEMFVNVTIHLSGTVNGQPVDRTRQSQISIQLGTGTYQVAWNGPVTSEHENTRVVQVPAASGPLHAIGGPLLLFASLSALAMLIVVHGRDVVSLSDAERDRLAYNDDRSDFDEWITPIRLPDETLDGPEAEAASLQDLVEFAIDTDSAVIEDADRDAYFVFHDNVRYAYYPSEPVTDATDINDSSQTLFEDVPGVLPSNTVEEEEPREE
ncbi:DUF5305 domain-containing protein [Halomicrococcus sp. NG-SE-24]|uniref:DUF5305 domain-containing protein n=1 Tax=Halomicrococcus sp. NG-SE-24 TaxID=3436928 RepID=UPI003D95EC1B